jgi:anti-sigma regulatory factor (Ser/Thr protein kinase)
MTAPGRPAAGLRPELDLRLANDLAGVGAAQARLAEWLGGRPLDAKCRHRIELVFEELAMNVVMHAYPEEEAGRHEITARLALGEEAAELSIEDGGTPFDPRGKAGARLSGTIEDAQIGGLGLLLVQEMTSFIDHQRTPEGRNRTRVGIALR